MRRRRPNSPLPCQLPADGAACGRRPRSQTGPARHAARMRGYAGAGLCGCGEARAGRSLPGPLPPRKPAGTGGDVKAPARRPPPTASVAHRRGTGSGGHGPAASLLRRAFDGRGFSRPRSAAEACLARIPAGGAGLEIRPAMLTRAMLTRATRAGDLTRRSGRARGGTSRPESRHQNSVSADPVRGGDAGSSVRWFPGSAAGRCATLPCRSLRQRDGFAVRRRGLRQGRSCARPAAGRRPGFSRAWRPAPAKCPSAAP